jgi:hypothetical protein
MTSLHLFPRLAVPPAQGQPDFSQKTSLRTWSQQRTRKLIETTAVLWVGLCLTLALGELPKNGRTAVASEQESQATSVGKQTPLHQVIVRRVNGRPISSAQVEFLRISRGITDQDAAAAHKSLTETLVDNELIREFLARQKVTVADADIARRKEQFIQQWKNFGYDLPAITKSWGLAEPAWTADITAPLAWYVYSQSQINDAAIAAEFKRQPARWNGTRLQNEDSGGAVKYGSRDPPIQRISIGQPGGRRGLVRLSRSATGGSQQCRLSAKGGRSRDSRGIATGDSFDRSHRYPPG